MTTWSEKCRERRARGLCHKCDSPPVPGRTECQHHLAITAAAKRRRRAERAAEGKCQDCDSPRAKGDPVYCKRHRERQREANRTHNAKRQRK